MKGVGSSVRGVSGIRSVDDIFSNPKSLKGLTPDDLKNLNLPSNWKIETLRKGSKKGEGYVLREYALNGNETGRQIRWHTMVRILIRG